MENATKSAFLTELTTSEQEFLTLIEEIAAADALTDDDRHQLSFELEVLSDELRACIDPSSWAQ